jgi:hypothetical protein
MDNIYSLPDSIHLLTGVMVIASLVFPAALPIVWGEAVGNTCSHREQ